MRGRCDSSTRIHHREEEVHGALSNRGNGALRCSSLKSESISGLSVNLSAQGALRMSCILKRSGL